MKRQKPEVSETSGSSKSSDEEGSINGNGNGYGEEEGEFDGNEEGERGDEFEADGDYGEEEDPLEDEDFGEEEDRDSEEEPDDQPVEDGDFGEEEDRGSEEEPDDQPVDLAESLEEEDGDQDNPGQSVAKAGTEDVKTLLRRMNSKADNSGSSEDITTSSDISLANRKNMKNLQSVVRDHELPLRIAYEQLDELAANAEKVKTAIEKNRSLLNVQVKKGNSRYLRAAFAAWRLDLDWQKKKRRDVTRANTWRKKSLMLRAFKSWTRDRMSNAKVKRLGKSAGRIIQRHNLRRCWKAWLTLVWEKQRDQEEHRKEKRLVKDLDSRYQEKICRRACNFMYRWRLRRKFLAFRDGCENSRLQGDWEEGLGKNLSKKKLKRLYLAWRRETKESNNLRAFLQARLRKRILWNCFKQWQLWMRNKLSRAESLDVPTQEAFQEVVAGPFTAWACLIHEKKASRELSGHDTPPVGSQFLKDSFGAFVGGCLESKRRGNIEQLALRKMQGRRLKKAFQAWVCFMQVQAQKKMVMLQEHIIALETESDRLRNENQRLAHVIDSGNWGQERISELVQASQVLTSERDALTKLLGRMQRQHSFALNQQRQHEVEVQELKRQLMGKKHLIRNKLLVKGASSFNSLVKAMKDDVLKNGNNNEMLYTIDKLAMDEVTVFPDGDLRVKSMTNFDRGKGNWSRHSSPTSNPLNPSSESHRASTPPLRMSTPTSKFAWTRTPQKSPTNGYDNIAFHSAISPSSSPWTNREKTE